MKNSQRLINQTHQMVLSHEEKEMKGRAQLISESLLKSEEDFMDSWFDNLSPEMEEEEDKWRPYHIGTWIQECMDTMDRCQVISWESERKNTYVKVLDHVVLAIIRDWPFTVTDGEIDPQNQYERSLRDKLQGCYMDNVERINSRREMEETMRWNAGSRDPGAAELCSANKGDWEYSRKQQERDYYTARSENTLLRELEKNYGWLGQDKERYEAWKNVFVFMLESMRTVTLKDGKAWRFSSKQRHQAWNFLKMCRDHWTKALKNSPLKDEEGNVVGTKLGYSSNRRYFSPQWSYSPMSVLVLFSKRLRAQGRMMHFGFRKYWRLSQKVSMAFRALGKEQRPLGLHLDEEKLQKAQEREQMEDMAPLEEVVPWMQDEAPLPEELVIAAWDEV